VESLDVGVVGCGTAGPAAALFLARQGHRITLYERVAEPGPVGAGILLQPSGMAVLAALGLLEPVLARGARVDGLRAVDPRQRVIVDLRYRDLRESWFGLGLHRGVLFETLFAAVRATAAITLKSGVSIEKRADLDAHELVVVCDGARSQLRNGSPLVKRAIPYRWGALWFVADDPEPVFDRELFQVVDGTRRLLGLLPTGLGTGGTSRKVSLFWSIRADRVGTFRFGDFARWKSDVLAYAPRAGAVLEQIRDASALLFSDYHDVVMRPWHDRNTVFLGDSAHSTSPQLGQGTNLALCDAAQLAVSLAAHETVDAALADYSRARRAHLGWYQFATRWLTLGFQSDQVWLAPLRDRLMPLACRIPVVRRLMLSSMAGISRGPLRAPLPVKNIHC
jgi:2-polyprenyl-6-methoxyphenol hydroxylase-like FAD-dependent oxidoreductase